MPRRDDAIRENFVEEVSHGADETLALGQNFAGTLSPGETVGLIGELGSGKTVFVQGICSGLGFSGLVTSPTFTLVHEYASDPPIYHFDCFRLRNLNEITTAGFEDYLDKQGILLVEWAEKIRDYFDRWTWEIVFDFVLGEENSRQIRFSGVSSQKLKNIEKLLNSAMRQTRGIEA